MEQEIFSTELIRQMLISSVIVWGVVGAVKPVLKKSIPAEWKNFIIRILSLIIGFASGWIICKEIPHAMAGAAGGAMSALLVGVFKAILKKRLGVEVEEPAAEEAAEQEKQEQE